MNHTIKSQKNDHKILVEQVKMLYQSMVSLLLINLIISTTLVYAFWDVISHTTLLIWMGIMFIMLSVRTVIYLSYKNTFDSHHVTKFSRFLVFGSAAAGLIWGAAGIFLLSPTQVDYQLFMLLCLMAMAGGSTFTLSVYLPAYYAFAPLALIPISIQLLLMGDSIHLTMGIVGLVFLVALTSFNQKMNSSFKNSLQMRYENLDLIKQLHAQKIQADDANKAKSKFLAAASHDLRQPLYSLSLFTSVLDETITDPKINKITDQINSSVNALKSLFDSLLDISKLDSGVIKDEKSNFFLHDIFLKLDNDLTPQALEKGLKINFSNCSYAVNSDPNLLEQILRNFISNAIRYTNKGDIKVKCEHINNVIIIKVIDTGIGIDNSEHEHIFSEFYQLGNPERDRQKGLGLGLSIVQRAAKILDHKIEMQSQLEKGSTFSISVAQAKSLPPTNPQINQHQIENTLDNQSLIIVIDDEKSIREGLQQLLGIWQYHVVTAIDGNDALEKLQSLNQKPDAIITDFRLPNEQTGLDVIDLINNEFQSDIPALIVTGDIEKHRLIEMNNRDYEILYKPVPALKLRAFLNSLQ